ncbi:hypothetical protein KKI24_25855 [bacterium]|nr:hypothetical protein [bacterium]
MEQEGIPTTQISLIRLHTEKIKPPRALWVPFELGRPLGVPNDPGFQSRVLLAALRLLEVSNGPVISDFSEDAPASNDMVTTLSCPVNLNPKIENLNDTEKLMAAFKNEISGLRSWYDLGLEKKGRTTVGASGMTPEAIGDFVSSLISGKTIENPREDIALGFSVNLAISDLKAYYSEAITAQPGQEAPSSKLISHWFWTETVASRVIHTLKETCLESEDKLLKLVGRSLLVPAEYA